MDLVTGSTGFIGNVLIRQLLKRSRKVRAFLRSSSDISILGDLDIEKVTGNILDTGSMVKTFKGVDTVYHLAAMITILSGENRLLREINLEGTRNVLKACLKAGVGKLVYTSSIHALKEPPEGITINENMPYDPENLRGEYDRSKAQASIEVMEAGKRDIHTVILCPTGTLGPYDWRLSPITNTFLNFYNGKMNMGINGAFDFVDVRDVAEGHIMAAEKAETGENFILSGERVTMKRMFGILEEITSVKGPSIYVPTLLAKAYCFFTPLYYRMSKKTPTFTNYSINTLQGNSFVSHRKASKKLGYKARSVKESIGDTFKWFREFGFIK